MEYTFWYTASAVPWYQCSLTRFCGGRISTNSPSSSETMLQPIRMWRFKRERFVLRRDEDAAQPGVDAIAEGEVDDPVRPAEKHRRFGAISGQRIQTLAGASREQDDKGIVDHAKTLDQKGFATQPV